MCTSFRLTAKDDSVCIARTMDFPDMLGTMVAVIPRSRAFTSVIDFATTDFTSGAWSRL